ncbi:MAG: hypothetical protein Q8R00_02275 [Candidatus Nanoarchaeia archaeon]|nr:hypothetical protein [Candidatus Nanoarchaeia archaeon]
MKYEYGIIILIAVSFFTTLLITPWVIRFMRNIGLNVKDMNKKGKPLVPISGGFAVLIGICAGIMVALFAQTFIANSSEGIATLLAVTVSILIITLVGFIDDLMIKRDKSSSSGLKQWQKPLMTLTAAIPLMVINAGTSTMYLPFLGTVDIGLLYPLLFVPLGVVGAANMVNLLAGYNGLEAGLGIIYTGTLGLYAFVNGRNLAAMMALITFGALLAFYHYNKVPAKILAGDSLTYLLGGIFACIAIIGNIEKAALIAAIPFIAEFFLKARSKFKAQSYGEWKDGKIITKTDKIYSIPHIFGRTGRFTEKQIVFFILAIEFIFANLIWFV